MRFIFGVIVVFTSGVVFGLNVAVLYPNPVYDAAEWKLMLALIMTALGAAIAQGGRDE